MGVWGMGQEARETIYVCRLLCLQAEGPDGGDSRHLLQHELHVGAALVQAELVRLHHDILRRLTIHLRS